MARTDKVEQIYNSILSKLNTATAWENMLHRTAQFWKLSFVEAMLLTEQKPDATMCASLDQWNKIHRYVRRGEKAIAVYKSASDTELRYLFDISQSPELSPGEEHACMDHRQTYDMACLMNARRVSCIERYLHPSLCHKYNTYNHGEASF